MDYAAYLRERALEFRNLALTTRDVTACQALYHLADLCAEKAATLVGHDQPATARAKPVASLRTRY
ncbi:MAG TPA: hypothetical protein VJO12_14130 [Stellaceae bacterium]|nr:hypothetical protein [Stellaceae bacterium]